MNIIKNPEWASVLVLIITAGIALWIGITQNSINKKIARIQDTVEVFSYTSSQPIKGSNWLLKLVNVGNVQLYITGYDINGIVTSLDNALLPAGQQQSAWFGILLPTPEQIPIHVVVKLSDKFQRNWESKIDINYNNNEWETVTHEIQRVN